MGDLLNHTWRSTTAPNQVGGGYLFPYRKFLLSGQTSNGKGLINFLGTDGFTKNTFTNPVGHASATNGILVDTSTTTISRTAGTKILGNLGASAISNTGTGGSFQNATWDLMSDYERTTDLGFNCLFKPDYVVVTTTSGTFNNYTWQGSYDGITWDTLLTAGLFLSTNNQVFNLSAKRFYRYLRGYNNVGNNVNTPSIEFYGTVIHYRFNKFLTKQN